MGWGWGWGEACNGAGTGLTVGWWQAPGVPGLCCLPLGVGGVWGCTILKLSTACPPAWTLFPIRVWCWAVCASIPPVSEQAKIGAVSEQAKIGAVVPFLGFGLHPTMVNGVPGAMLWHLFPNTFPQKAVYLIAYNLIAIKTISEGCDHLAASPCLMSKYWGAKPGGSTSTALALLPCSISSGRVSAQDHQG